MTKPRQATRDGLPSGFMDFVRDYFKEHVDIIDGEYLHVDTSDYLNDGEPYVDFYISAYVYNRYGYDGREVRIRELEGRIDLYHVSEDTGEPDEEPYATMEVTDRTFPL